MGEHLNDRFQPNVKLKKNKYYFDKSQNIIVRYISDKSFLDIFGNNTLVNDNELEYYCSNFNSIKNKENLFIELLTKKSLLMNYLIKKLYKNNDEFSKYL